MAEPNRTIAGRYELIRMVGRGGFGDVWLGRRQDNGQPVAVKLLAKFDKPNATARERFLREASTIALLRSPNTVRLYDSGCEPDDTLFMVLEYIDGVNLETRLQAVGVRGLVPSQAEAIELGIQVLRSLAEAHKAGIVHRDIKPSNLMLQPIDSDACMVRVLDFGGARTRQSTLTGVGLAVGTPTYMSPEQCLGYPVDGRADLYALGVLLYRCLAERAPFEGKTGVVVMQHITQLPPSLALSARTPVSEAFVAVVARALAKDPEQRFADATEMRRALEAARAGSPDAVGSGLLVPNTASQATVSDLLAGAPVVLPTVDAATLPELELLQATHKERGRG